MRSFSPVYFLLCPECGYHKDTSAILRSSNFSTVQEIRSSINKFKCSECGSKNIKLKEKPSTQKIIRIIKKAHTKPNKNHSRVGSSKPNKPRKKRSDFKSEQEKNRFLLSSHIKNDRKSYLEDKKSYYESLTRDMLDIVWANRLNEEIKEDEILLIRNILRDKIGIKPIDDVRARTDFCPKCSLPSESCTCEKGWW